MHKPQLSIITLILTCFCILSTEAQTDSSLRKGEAIFKPVVLDPIESYTGGSLAMIRNQGKHFTDNIYAPFAIGFSKAFYEKHKPERKVSHQLHLELGVFTQFEWLDYGSQRNILNTDFKLGLNWHKKFETFELRLRTWHISSHRGDDYMVRRGVANFERKVTKQLNYEWADLMLSKNIGAYRIYGGIGATTRWATNRNWFSTQAGFEYHKPLNNAKNVWFFLGADCKTWQYTGFFLNTNTATGIRLGEENRYRFSFLLSHYYGHLPYSGNEKYPLELQFKPASAPEYEWGGRVQWISVGIYMNPML